MGIITLLCLAGPLVNTKGLQFLSPGPLISAHSTIEDCSACHTQSQPGKFGWIQRILRDERTNDVQACIKCHKVRGDVLFAHTAPKPELEAAQQRLLKISNQIPQPLSAKVRSLMFPKQHLRVHNLPCANCHQEHQGTDFNLEAISDDQCQACHVVQFDSFDGDHPKFGDFPFKRRTRLIYDHASHFSKYFPQTKEKNPQRNIPANCSSCHTSQKDRRQMMLTSFDATCSGCHLDQILGKERVIGPKGIAFLTLPGVDVITLKEKNAAIGEWPETSEAEVTPFMKVLLSRNKVGKELLKKIDKLDLLDLTQATDQEIETVTRFIWEIKELFHRLISGPASDVMATLPRDVIVAAQREWLPNLGSEMAGRTGATGADSLSSPSETRLSGSVTPDELPPFRPFDKAGSAGKDIHDFQHHAQANSSYGWRVDPFGKVIREHKQPAAEAPAGAGADSGADAPAEADAEPTAERATSNAAEVDADAAATPADAIPTPAFVPIESTVNAETWAEYGGWYRQDFAIHYRPVGHKDQFIRAWLDLTGPYALESGPSPAAQLFNFLATKGVQGECVKCHSVDTVPGKGRKVNWSPALPETKRGRFTTFIHEPHFGVLENKGCLTCHKLQQGVPYSTSFEQGNPQSFVSGFSQVDKNLCQTCHTKRAARQDCMLCHKYHVNGIVTPMLETRLPQ